MKRFLITVLEAIIFTLALWVLLWDMPLDDDARPSRF